MINIKKIPYIGNGPYCYANSLSMLLTLIGENISPSIIEVLSGVGLGAVFLKDKNLLFFSFETPDNGINNVLYLLGFEKSVKTFPKKAPPPLKELIKDLEKSPVVIGPLDMGYLIYNPHHQNLRGVDHFIFVYKMNEKEIFLHDPTGFPCVSLLLSQLESAWQSNIGYGNKNYTYWTVPKQTKKPSQFEVYQNAIKFFKKLYLIMENVAKRGNYLIGSQAILKTVERIKENKISQEEVDQLIYFALPLGAKRALDFAIFFDFKDNDLARLKRKQAELFGLSQALTTQKNWPALTKVLRELAFVEDQFKYLLLNKK